MKTIKILIVIIITGFITQNSYSQLSIGGQLSYLKLFGGTGLNGKGIGLKGDFAMNEKTIITGGFNYYKGNTYSGDVYGNALSSDISPNQILIPVEYKLSFMHIYGGVKRYFAGDCEEDFGFYGIVEAGLLMAPMVTKVGSYDSKNYYTSVTDGEKETFSNLTINPGIGIEQNVGFGYLYADLKLNLPANNANGVEVEIQIPTSVSVNLGVRIPLSK